MSRIKSFYPYFRDTLFAILIIFFLPSKADVSSLEKKMARIMTDQQTSQTEGDTIIDRIPGQARNDDFASRGKN